MIAMDSELNYLLLSFIASRECVELNDLCAALPVGPLALRQLVLEMKDASLLRVTGSANLRCAITPAGRLELLRMEERREQQRRALLERQAEEARRQREEHIFQRRERWKDRIAGFFAGIAVTVTAQLIIQALSG